MAHTLIGEVFAFACGESLCEMRWPSFNPVGRQHETSR